MQTHRESYSPCSDGPRAASFLGGGAFACKTSRGRQAGPAQCGRRQPSPDSPSSPHELLRAVGRGGGQERARRRLSTRKQSLNYRIIAVPQIRLSSSYGRCCLATGLPRCASSALSQLALEDCDKPRTASSLGRSVARTPSEEQARNLEDHDRERYGDGERRILRVCLGTRHTSASCVLAYQRTRSTDHRAAQTECQVFTLPVDRR